MAITLTSVQKTLVNETARPAIEKLISMRYYLDSLVLELDNQQDPISTAVDVLNDDPASDAPRSDAPSLRGDQLVQLRNFAANMRDQIDGASLNSLVGLAVRDVPTIIKSS